jgi:hypothetical protein
MMILILGEILLTPLQLLDFQQLPTILSHFDDFFGVFMGQERFSKAFFTNLLPLSPKGNGVLTFLQQSQQCISKNSPKGISGSTVDGTVRRFFSSFPAVSLSRFSYFSCFSGFGW